LDHVLIIEPLSDLFLNLFDSLSFKLLFLFFKLFFFL